MQFYFSHNYNIQILKMKFTFHPFLLGVLLLLTKTFTFVSAKTCSGQMIPGIERMARGVDITELDLTPTNLQSANGYRNTIVAFTCDDEIKWTSTEGTEYERPDEVAGVNVLPAGQLRTTVELSGDSEEYKRTRSLNVGLDVDTVKYGAYSASTGLKNVQENLYQKNRSVAETSATVSSMQVDFNTPASLTLKDGFANFLPTEPAVKKYQEDPTLYDNFIVTYGTHYWSSALFGGYLYLKTTIDEQYKMSSDETTITAELEASFKEKLKVKTDGEHSTSKVSDRFRKNTHSEFAYFGGTPVGSVGGEEPIGWMETWVPTVNKNPWLFAGKLTPIESFFPGNTELQAEVKKAVSVHMTRAYLKELKEIVRLGGFRLSSEQKTTVESAERKLKSKEAKDVQELVRDLESIFRVVENLRDLALLSQLKITWNDKIPDIVKCKTYVISACALHLRDSNKKEVAPVLAFPPRIDALLQKSSRLDHEQAKALLKAAATMIAHQERKLDLCQPGKYQDMCEQCIRTASNYGVKAKPEPFCRSQESWVVISHTPIHG